MQLYRNSAPLGLQGGSAVSLHFFLHYIVRCGGPASELTLSISISRVLARWGLLDEGEYGPLLGPAC